MENEKLLVQELEHIDELWDQSDRKEQHDVLIARAKAICPFWLPPSERQGFDLASLFKQVKGGVHTMEVITIKGVPVIDIYESFEGSYWFITEKCFKQDSVIGGKVYKNDQILFGYARLSACPQFAEFGYISQAELERLSPRVWKVPKKNWSVCPEVKVQYLDPDAKDKKGGEKSSPLSFYSHV